MKCKFLLMLLSSAVALQAALIKDVRFNCANNCQMEFQFASDKNLPTFYQKYDNASNTLTVGFSESDFALGVGKYDVDQSSSFVRSMRVFKEAYRGMDFLKIEIKVGASVNSDKNAIALNKSSFLLKFAGSNGKSWTLSKLYAANKKAAEKAAREEEKRLAAERKAAEKQAVLDRKAAEKQAALDRKAAREEEKRLAAERKAAEKAAAQNMAPVPVAQAGASALLPGIKEMTVLIGSGMEQFDQDLG